VASHFEGTFERGAANWGKGLALCLCLYCLAHHFTQRKHCLS